MQFFCPDDPQVKSGAWRLSETLRDELHWKGFYLHDFPLVLAESQCQELVKLQGLLREALLKLVPAYYSDERVSRRLLQTEWAEELLSHLKDEPYETDSLRPDFLYDLEGNPLICEINARFPSNGFLVSHKLNKIASEHYSASLTGLPRLEEISRTFVPDEDLSVVLATERARDVLTLLFLMREQGHECSFVGPEEVSKLSGRVLLQLHQHEIESLPVQTWVDFHHRTDYFNDLRTIFLVHDKRMLSVLSDEELLQDYLPAEDAQWLSARIVATYERTRPGRPARASSLLKPNQLGKGEGILLGRELTDEQWEERFSTGNYVVQPIIDQKLLELDRRGEAYLVGTLPMWRHHLYGPGIFRASKKLIANLATGGQIVFGMLPQQEVMRPSTSESNVPKFEEIKN
jgi:hypothetical protein